MKAVPQNFPFPSGIAGFGNFGYRQKLLSGNGKMLAVLRTPQGGRLTLLLAKLDFGKTLFRPSFTREFSLRTLSISQCHRQN